MITEKNWCITPGLQWNVPYKKTNVFYGIQLPFNKYGEIKINYRSEAFWNNIITSAIEARVNIPGGYSFGIGSFWGIGININKHIAVSTELSCDYFIYSVFAKGLTTSSIITYHYYPSDSTETILGHHDNTTEKFGVLSIKGALKFSFSF